MEDCKWNLITYLLFTGNTGMFDWVMKNNKVSLLDALKDGGDEQSTWVIDMCPLSSFGLYASLMKRRNKKGLIHLAHHYPTAISMKDWKSIVKICLLQHDYESLVVLNCNGMKAVFN